MELRFFADQCVPTIVIEDLRDAGYEVFYLRDHLPIGNQFCLINLNLYGMSFKWLCLLLYEWQNGTYCFVKS